MKTETKWKALVGGVATVGLILGAAGGFFGAHMTMGDMTGSQKMDMKQMPAKDTSMKDRKSTRLNSSHIQKSRMPSSA